MAKLFNQAKFSFIGEVVSAKEPVSRKRLNEKSAWFKTRMSIGVKADTNSQFLHMEYLHEENPTTFKLFDKDGKPFDVNVNDTTSEAVLSKVMDVAKITIDLETDQDKKKEYTSLIYKVRNHEKEISNIKKQDSISAEDETKIAELQEKINTYNNQIKELADNRVQFCHMKDVINHMNSKLPELAGKKVRVTGNVKCNYYNGKNTLQYVPTFIEIVPNETESILLMTAEIFYDKDSVMDDAKEKKMVVNGYITDRLNKQDKLFPITIGLDYTAVDETNQAHMNFLTFMRSTFDITDKKQVHKTKALIKIINGAEVVEFTEDCLTDRQKMQIAIGQKTLDDFKPKGNIYGNRVQELRLYEPVLTGDFDNGAIEVFPVKELEDYIVADDSDMKVSDIKETKDVAPKAEQTLEDKRATMNALFK